MAEERKAERVEKLTSVLESTRRFVIEASKTRSDGGDSRSERPDVSKST